MSFNNLVVMLDLEKEYAEFVSSSDGKFKDVAESAPALVNGIISGVFYYRRHGRSPESIHLVVEAMLAPGTGLLQNVVLGKLADYVRIIWSHQPTRKFVPVLLLRGIHMTMVIFTRGKYHCVELGEFMLNTPSPAFDQLDYIADTFQRLWFILMQPSNRFGHIVDISADFRYWRFGGKASKATVELSTFKDNLAHFESLFYAILYALSYLSDGPDKCLGFSIPNNSLAGATKLGLVAGKKSYLQMFGVYKYTDEMQRRISILYNTLFRYGGKSIACELVDDEDDPRELDKIGP
ncbi:hypothetical protein IWW52_002434 [Coemansia sp. RSA 2704]|nr:hypothetical protein IWW52_002434 [Coemansia sp. RSA 2704]